MAQEDRYRPMVHVVDDTDGVAQRPGSRRCFEARQRESRTIRLALTLLGHDRAEAFLHHHNAELDGRPIAVAADSADGATAVERLIMLARQTDNGFLPTDRSE